ncbi:MAG: TIGR02147 family protein [Chitinispirillaceae bacterium]|nr:TIGR02147 family protein [Chitinispirillaceae bacterium]
MNIYEYDDFRLYLQHRYELRCKEDPSYTYRKFASEASFSNPGFLNDVIKGRRKLSRDAVGKMIGVFGLSEIEAEFFRLLVAYRQTRDQDEQQELYRKILFRRNRSSFARLNPIQSKYYQDYRYALIRTALMATDFSGDYDALGRFTIPPIPSAQVKKYIRDLCDWGMVTQQSDGKYAVTDLVVEPPETLRDQVKQINREWIIQSIEPLMKLSPEKRYISSMLLSVSSKTAKKIRERIEALREEIWDAVNGDDEKADSIMLLNVQYVPKSRRTERI